MFKYVVTPTAIFFYLYTNFFSLSFHLKQKSHIEWNFRVPKIRKEEEEKEKISVDCKKYEDAGIQGGKNKKKWEENKNKQEIVLQKCAAWCQKCAAW